MTADASHSQLSIKPVEGDSSCGEVNLAAAD